MDWKFAGFVFLAALSGCATLDSDTAADRSSMDLCKIAVVGTANHGWTTVDSAGRVAAEQEALRRGVDCMDHAASIENAELEHRTMVSQSLESAARQSEQVQRSAEAPIPVVRPSTTCRPASNGLTHCTTTFSDGSPPLSTTCKTLSNGNTTCN